MQHTRTIYTILLCGLLSFSALAQSEENNLAQHRIDSIYAHIHTLEGKARFDAYLLTVVSGSVGDFEAQIALLNEYIEYAHTQKNEKEESTARVNRAIIYYNNGHWDDYLPSLAEDKVFWDKYEQWDAYFNVEYYYIYMLLASDRYETALDQAKKQYDFAKEHNHTYGMGTTLTAMGLAYIKLNRFEEGSRCFREAINLLKECEQPNMRFEAYFRFCDALVQNNKYSETENILKEWETNMKELPEKQKDLFKMIWLNYFYLYARMNIEMERFEQAKSALVEAQRLTDELNIDIGNYLIKDARLRLFMKQGNYPKAALMLDTLHTKYQMENYDMVAYLKKKAKIAFHLGDYPMAATTYNELYQYSDSIQQAIMSARLDELHTIYEVDKLTLEKERNRNYMLFALAVCLLLVIVLAGWIFYSHRLKLKNMGLVRQILEQDRVAAEKEQQEEELRKYRNLVKEQNSNHLESNKKEDELLDHLKLLMKDSKNFTDPNLNRKTLAEKLNTNENYLWETIKKQYGSTIGEYITDARLNYARELLFHQGEKYTIEAAAMDAGLGTRRTFQRLFKKKYGLTPEEYRKLLTENNDLANRTI